MRFAIIDLGTNSVRFDVHALEGTGVRTLYREKLMVRLGEGVFETGTLAREAKTRTIQAFQTFAQKIRDLHARRVFAYATSAIREARDGADFLRLLHHRTGIGVSVMPGPEEARLIALGIRQGERAELPRRYALIDIGGGSTEVSVYQGSRCLFSHSYPLGTARLQQSGLDNERLRAEIRRVLDEGPTIPSAPKALGSSGTVRTLLRITRKNGGKPGRRKNNRWVRVRDLSRRVERMSTLSLTSLKRIPGMDPRRVETICAGGILLDEALRALGAKTCSLSEFTLRDGIRAEVLSKVDAARVRGQGWDPDVFRPIARRCGCQPSHTRRIERAAAEFFDRLISVHRLGGAWRRMIQAAAIARDLGELASIQNHDQHSAYLVRASAQSIVPDDELEIIAELCRHHENREIRRAELPATWSRKRFRDFEKAVALLRLADALDSRRAAPVVFRSVKITSRAISRGGPRVRVVFRRGGVHELDLLWLESKKRLYETTFGHEIAFALAPSDRRGPRRRGHSSAPMRKSKR